MKRYMLILNGILKNEFYHREHRGALRFTEKKQGQRKLFT